MNKTTIFAIAICLALVYAHAAVITVPVTKDAQVTFQSRACAPDTCPNVGADQTIVVGNFQITSIGLFGFNFAASIPAGSTINSASLQLPGGYSPTGSNPITVSAYELDSNTWGEYTVVWSNRPTYSTLVGTTVFTMPNAPAPIDVTASVQSALTSAGGSLGFAVTAESPYNIFFIARESTTGTAASLTIDYTAPSTPVTCGSGACGGSDLCCGSVCYNPATHSCTANDRLCPVGFDSCGTACYNPSQYVCYGTVLCPSGHLQCGGTCYRPTMYSCCSGVLSPAGSSC